MSLSQSEQQQAHNQAESRYAAAHPELRSNEGMESDPEFLRMYSEAAASIESSHVSTPATTAPRSDTVVAPCPFREQALSTENCNFTLLQVNKSGDTNRVYRSGSGQPRIIEIVAGRVSAKATMELRLSGVSISCDTHNQRVWNVSPLLPGTNLTSNSSLDMSLGWTGNVSELGFFNQNIRPTRYEVGANTHNRAENIAINVYPDYAWSGSASVNFTINQSTRHVEYGGLNIQLSRTDDNRTSQYGGRVQEIVDLLARFFGFTFLIKDICQTVAAGAVEFGVVPPSFVITIGSRWQENLRTLRCGYYYTLTIAFTPLVGISVNVNLGIVAIQAIPYIGRLVAGMAGPAISRYIAITFTIQSTISVDVTASKSADSDSGTLNGGLTGQIAFDFSIRGQINRDFGLFAVNCGLSGGARGSVTVALRGPLIDRSGSYASLGANFDGLTLYARAYCRAGSSETTRFETTREQAGGSGEETYLWIAARPLGSEIRINI